MKDLSQFESIIGVTFNNKDLLKQSVVHRSYINEHPDFALGNNERLEFLGDAVLELSVTRHLFLTYPEKPEGELTNWRASLVKGDTLADVAEELHLNDYLHLSKGESKDSNTKARRYILANAFEALTGAIYLDQGFDKANDFIQRVLIPRFKTILEDRLYLDPKSLFQEKSQELEAVTPHYQVLSESGPDHAKKFVVGVYLNDKEIANGTGASKQEAEQSAAQEGLRVKKWINQ